MRSNRHLPGTVSPKSNDVRAVRHSGRVCRGKDIDVARRGNADRLAKHGARRSVGLAMGDTENAWNGDSFIQSAANCGHRRIGASLGYQVDIAAGPDVDTITDVDLGRSSFDHHGGRQR